MSKDSGPKIVKFDAHTVITQSDIARERIPYHKGLRTFETWQEKHCEIRAAIESGATVEDGMYLAEILEQTRQSDVLDFPFKVVRLVIT